MAEELFSPDKACGGLIAVRESVTLQGCRTLSAGFLTATTANGWSAPIAGISPTKTRKSSWDQSLPLLIGFCYAVGQSNHDRDSGRCRPATWNSARRLRRVPGVRPGRKRRHGSCSTVSLACTASVASARSKSCSGRDLPRQIRWTLPASAPAPRAWKWPCSPGNAFPGTESLFQRCAGPWRDGGSAARRVWANQLATRRKIRGGFTASNLALQSCRLRPRYESGKPLLVKAGPFGAGSRNSSFLTGATDSAFVRPA